MTLLEEIVIPKDTVNDEFVIITSILVSEGDSVSSNTPILEYETSKSNIEIVSNNKGYIYLDCSEGDEIKVGKKVASVFDEIQKNYKISKPEEASKPSKALISKSALKLIESNKLDLSLFEGKKTVSEEDVLKILNLDVAKPDTNIESLELSVEKKREIEYLSSVQSSGLTSTVNVCLSTHALESIISRDSIFSNSVLPLVVYEISSLLNEYREFNSYFDDNFINFYKSVDIGIALDIEKGLRVATIKKTDSYSFDEICNELENLVNLYLEDNLSADNITSPTFTITDLSFENINSFIPLINKNNSAILGISSIDKSNEVILSLTFDHRISSGKQASRFLNELKRNVESHMFSRKKFTISSETCLKCNVDFKNLEDDFGFVKILTKEGNEGFCCRSCFNGW
ncbi:MAG: hypothetical protein CL678_14665 [Bdellovibrionaceae bacterium]|nr:hypothetical protein [Pseudobdellovibrionaceae bacterium]|tara:strand:- start:6662 stop:7864 length:1203 start_codon:yes stop_codon:yes gene_type:complete